ncbi:RNA polymerase sigma factor [Niastella sp. OAS944]|uniref:RNA polymerase sigma factor n=1 Tax=Niastella sp. OAS944 TaxID=2664089 RepID=UPI00348E703D|nr:RNA polymerase sigma-70 factor (ECF subfamily) [Chitinophagaceae bacterium OAS944]
MSFQPSYTEHELLKLVAEGDRNAFTQLYNNYRNKIYSIAFELTESTTVAEEIVQDVFLKIWVKRDSLHEVEHFKAYLFTITRNYVFTALKRIARQESLEVSAIQDAPLYDHDTEDRVLNKEYTRILQAAIDRLPEQQKQVYNLIKKEGLKREEAAAALHLSPETVKTHLAQAMRSIRTYCLARLDISIALIILIRNY